METASQQLTKIMANVEHLRYLAGAYPHEFEFCISSTELSEIAEKLQNEIDHVTDELNRKRISV